jgi:hypothetical protein
VIPHPPNSSPRLRRSRAWQGIVFGLLLVALLLQETAIQAHLHFIERAGATAEASHGAGSYSSNHDKTGIPADCRLCQEAALAGAYLLPAAIVVSLLPNDLAWASEAKLAEFRLLAQPLGWLSRAPPR